MSDLKIDSLNDIPISMVLKDTGKSLTKWIDYSFNSNFLCPTAGFHFTTGGLTRSELTDLGIVTGAHIGLKIGELFVADGYIDSIELSADRHGGTVARIEGRDSLGYAVDSHVSPKVQVKETQTIADVCRMILGPFGFDNFVVQNDDNIKLQQGVVRGERTSKGKKTFGKPLASVKLHQAKPYPHEGALSFLARVLQRHGLWVCAAADGNSIIVGRPNYDRAPSHTLTRAQDKTNVLDGAVKIDIGTQPTLIIADGFSGLPEYGKSHLRARMANPCVDTTDAELLTVWNAHAGVSRVEIGAVGEPTRVKKSRVLYLHDDESLTQNQIENYVLREMSLYLRRALQATYSVAGHGQIIEGAFVPFAVDTIVTVNDEVAGLKEDLWVLGRTFQKSRQGGTTTRLELIRKHSLELGDTSSDFEDVKAALAAGRQRSAIDKRLG